jgi:hypothetical protein
MSDFTLADLMRSARPMAAKTGAGTLADLMRNARPGPYQTRLSFPEESEFMGWVQSNRVPYDAGPLADYDMRGFWKALKAGDPRAQQSYSPFDASMHFPDVWKTPYHQSFSNESIYALPTAPHWAGEKLVDKLGTVLVDESRRKKK